jgi:N-acetylglutamate synthase-like GNAT family acetyltransferase
MDESRIVTVTAANIDEYGFFCLMSRRRSEGYRRKHDWLLQRFEEGLKLKLVIEGERPVGFIEYAPAEVAWRPVRAKGYVVIHCLWVVGRWKDKGYGTRLLRNCVQDARRMGAHGVVMVTSPRTWLAGSELFAKNGFECVDEAPPSFELMVKRFDDAPLPRFPKDWVKRGREFGSGLTIVRTDQCPYIEDATRIVAEAAREKGVDAQVVSCEKSPRARSRSPSAFGTFGIIWDGELLSYHYLTKKQFLAACQLDQA